MSDHEIIPTHSAYLELKAERVGMQEGYRFLDEKRLILASRILAQLKDYEDTMLLWERAQAEALTALRAALGRHGVEELSVYPVPEAVDCPPAESSSSVLGVRVVELPPLIRDDQTEGRSSDALTSALRSPEAEACRARFELLPPLAARLAILNGNLERLRSEYVRTARRARALEDVLLPEIDDSLRAIDTALEELEREEAMRMRSLARPV